MTKTLLALIIIFGLTGCSSNPIVTEPTIVKLTPPELLTEPTIIPRFIGKDNEDLIEWALDLKSHLEQCNVDKKSIRDWSKDK